MLQSWRVGWSCAIANVYNKLYQCTNAYERAQVANAMPVSNMLLSLSAMIWSLKFHTSSAVSAPVIDVRRSQLLLRTTLTCCNSPRATPHSECQRPAAQRWTLLGMASTPTQQRCLVGAYKHYSTCKWLYDMLGPPRCGTGWHRSQSLVRAAVEDQQSITDSHYT